MFKYGIMRKVILIWGVLFFSFIAKASFRVVPDFQLKIVVENLDVDYGVLMVEVVKGNGEVYKKLKVPVSSTQTIFDINDIPIGKYGVRYFHDENSNGFMDSYIVGIPKEGYGFSNNPPSKFGEPALKKILFEISDDITVVIKTVNW